MDKLENYDLDDVLNGEPNKDYKGVVRWRVSNSDSIFPPAYLTYDELGEYFEQFMNEMEDCLLCMEMASGVVK